ncbi:hypothetical protein [Nocardia iowensis]|uniref:Uncharacterized protein n=1 Tax=Nocardia iowensis TaxID=204891 RepID=A0ABX8RW26_NOCIO|nr:hypothetical protein [Nocardia iowensis]QXN93077.1 hypothetical protein KV110_08215 [Nocardia iowensis]
MERKLPDSTPRRERRGKRFAFGTGLLAASAVAFAVLAAPGSEAESKVDDNEPFSCRASAQVKLTKKDNNLTAETSNIAEADKTDEECEIGKASGEITDVSYKVNGGMCELTSSKGKGSALEGEPGGEEDVEGEGKAENANVTISVPLKDGGGKQGKFSAKFVTDPDNPDGKNSVTAQGNFPAAELQLESCDAASLPDAATVTVKGNASVKPQD